MEDDLDYLLPANCPNPYYDTWDRHNSIAFSTATKGLRNAPGENNCFVNSAVQVFWHLDVFRRSYRRLSGHTCMGNSCIFCALKVIFTQFQFSDQSSLHPDALRKALAETFANQQRFQLGHMDDAAECFENILRRIHFHIANNCNEDTCTAPHCLPHQKFSLNILEKVVCPCGSSSNPLKFNEMVHYISATALVSQARVMQETGDELHPDRFGLLLRNANAMGDIRDCPGSCGKKVQIRRTLLNSPDVVSIGLVWDSDHPSVETTTEVARNIGTTILMQDVFHSVMQDVRTLPRLQLVGLVCYYGKHYSTFVFHSKLQVWIYFDDATVKEIGPRWEHVVDKCGKGRYQPLLLLYANPNAAPVPVDTAPKKRVMAPGYGIPGGPDEESSLDRTHESITSQQSMHRSRTPNPEPSTVHKEQISPRARSVTPSTGMIGESRDDARSGEHSRQQSFLYAMSGKNEPKSKFPLRYGGQAGGGVPGPMMPVTDQQDGYPSPRDDGNYSDYTLSTSDQYRRPSLGGFEPARLPLTPNMKGYTEAQRKESFKKNRETIRADVVRYQVDPTHPQGAKSPDYQYQNLPGSGPSYDPNQPPALPPKLNNSSSMFYQGGSGPAFPHMRQRTISQGADEAYASDTGSCYDGHPSQHTVVKPMASNQNYDHLDGLSHAHTPVQSGLATLPRRKKDTSQDKGSSQLRQTPSMSSQDANSMQTSFANSKPSYPDQRPTSNPKFYTGDEVTGTDLKGLPPPAPNRQSTPTSGLTKESSKKLSESDKKAKKLKKELKKAEKKKMKENSKSTSDLSSTSKPGLHTSNSMGSFDKERPEEFRDDKMMYIDRRMVENILKHQGLQRQPSTHSTGSTSSIESDSLMGRLLAAKHNEMGLHTDASFDNVSLGSHKDSGYGSSDRNSSSSTGSGTIDPYTQYFISKSMVVPRNLNPQFLDRPPHQVVSDFTAPNPHVYTAAGNQDLQGKDLSNLSKEDLNRHLYETLTQRKIMHPIKESSQEDILKLMPQEPSSTPKPLGHTVSSGSAPQPQSESKEGRPPPIPPKNFAAFQVSKSSHQKEPSIDSLDKDEVKNDYFVSMCEKADELMDKCILAETQEDLSSALCFCDSALGCLKEAMNQTDISNKALVYAQKKHNSCLLKSRSLFKKTSGHSADGSMQGGKRSSITSTDSDNSDKPVRRTTSKDRLMPAGMARPSSRTGSQQPTGQQPVHQSLDPNNRKSPLPISQPMQVGSRPHVNQSSGSQLYPSPGSSSNSSLTSSTQGNPPSSHTMHSHISRSAAATDRTDAESVHSRSGSNSSVRSSASVPTSMSSHTTGPAMPKSQSTAGPMLPNTPAPIDAYGTLPRNRKPRRTSDPTGNSEVYQMYLNRQKHIQGSSGSDSRESDSSSCEGNGQKKVSKAEIRELLENNVVQRQLGQYNPSQQQQHYQQQSQEQRQRHSYDGAGQRSSTSSVSSVGSSHLQTMGGRPIVQHSQSSSVSSVSGQNLLGHSTHSSVSSDTTLVSSIQEVPNQPSSRQYHPSQTYQYPGQSNSQLSHHGPVRSTTQQSHRQSYENQSQYPSSSVPNPNNVSGYSQPLPGQRGVPSQSSSYQSSQSASASTSHMSGTGANFPSSHSQPQLSQNPALSHQSRQMPQNYSQSQTHTDPSQNYNTNSTTGYFRGSQPNGVQNLNQDVQNLNLNGSSRPVSRSSTGPPPPPARTTSNPEFKQVVNQPQSNQTSSNNMQHNLSQSTRSQPLGPSVARVQPNSHLAQTNLQHSQLRMSSQEAPAQMTHRHGFDPSQGTGLKHAVSSTNLNYLPMDPRPLERCASQPDCQNLVDSASYSNQPDISSYSFYGHPSNSNNSKTDVTRSGGQSLRLLQTSEHLANQNREDSDDEENKPNVRALASRFEQPTNKPEIRPKPSSLTSVSSRTRSKSESGSKKPKSVLKSKKAKSANGRPRKSVTFAEDMSSTAAGYESAAELTSFSSHAFDKERAYFSDDDDNLGSKPVVSFSDNDLDEVEDSSNSDDSPLPREELACQLCRKREVEMGKSYCSKCSFYMRRLVAS